MLAALNTITNAVVFKILYILKNGGNGTYDLWKASPVQPKEIEKAKISYKTVCTRSKLNKSFDLGWYMHFPSAFHFK